MATLAFAHTSGAEPVAGGRRRVGERDHRRPEANRADSGFGIGLRPRLLRLIH
jgi:hypothetical protein